MNLLPGAPRPLGATPDGGGCNFALYSENATAVELCLFSPHGEEKRFNLINRTAYVWHGYLPGVGKGTRYGFRVHGPYDPEQGHRFNPRVVLLDPYARAVDGVEDWGKGCFAFDLTKDDRSPIDDDQMGAPRAVVVDGDFDWEGDRPPGIPLARSVIYETHVHGLTMCHPEIPENLRGTYSGLAHPVMLKHLTTLGITAVELMPVHAFVDDKHLLDRGLSNYWGYNTVGFFAPDVRYKSTGEPGSEVTEFKRMVKALHSAGIEVILDVVYNHTAEGNHAGPTFNLKGIDNSVYYRLVPGEPRYYFDYTGTGNTLNVRHPQVLAMIMDSLRYWAREMHVDGFRFDLASALARQLHEVDQLSSFFTLIHQSPTLSGVKLIAEPWDVGEGGYQVGNFPVRWAEWNGRYRDSVRSLWRGDGGRLAEVGFRLTGSSDLYQPNGRRPSASINLVTSHDGFSLRDLVSYAHRHNQANGEENRDGNPDELSWNCGAEGPNDAPEIERLRRRHQRNLLATMILSQGTPMLLAGDETGRSQAGNNNAYCQNNPTTWVDWNWSEEARSLFQFTRKLLHLRRQHGSLRRANFFQGRPIHGAELHDLKWLRPDAVEMSEDDWEDPHTGAFSMYLAGRAIGDTDESGRPLVDDDLLVIFNPSATAVDFRLPATGAPNEPWQLLVDTADDRADEQRQSGDTSTLVAHSLKLFRANARVLRLGGAIHALQSTYRLQLRPGFGFREATEITDYLSKLGITDVYSSPITAATAGSPHGYDVVDHQRLNRDLGEESDFNAWSEALAVHRMGLFVDWVPNHMGIASPDNVLWNDVLESGPSAVSAEFFDIDWQPPKEGLRNRILLPILGDQYGEVLERGELRLVWDDGALRLAYGARRLPLGPKSTLPIWEAVLAKSSLADFAREELESILSALRNLPSKDATGVEQRRERKREKDVTRRRLDQLLAGENILRVSLETELAELNGDPGAPASFNRLDQILQNQSYRLASWQVAAEEINYRRFFDVNDLAAIRMEDPAVFSNAHSLLFRLVDEGRLCGLRLDHTDGLYDPRAYFESLQRRFLPAGAPSVPGASPDDLARPLPILVEKILAVDEQLPPEWPVDGTTGYEFAASVVGLWVDSRAERQLTDLYRRFTGDEKSYEDHVRESKSYVAQFSFASEVNMLARKLERIASSSRQWRDFTLISLTRALTEIIAAFSVYRTYLRGGEQPSPQDEALIIAAVKRARAANPSTSASVFSFLEDLLLMRTDPPPEKKEEHLGFALKFQQLTGPMMAKAVEDTAFYRYNRLACLNEVGGAPERFGTGVEEFHRGNRERARSWPLSMITTSTHDTKRGEDVAARIAALTEVPREWKDAVGAWSKLAEAARTWVDGAPAPSRTMEYLLYQTMIGSWPIGWDGRDGREDFAGRLSAFLVKASKEAKAQSSWINPNHAYDQAVSDFPGRLLAQEELVESMRGFCQSIDIAGAMNGLAQTTLRLTSPGVADTYQGAELWNQSLVDPDNRRPVDYITRQRMLERILAAGNERSSLCRTLLEDYRSGAVKLFVHWSLLMLRRGHSELFLRGDYEAIPAPERVVAFSRRFDGTRLLCVVPRLTRALGSGWPMGSRWGDERLRIPVAGHFRNVFTDAGLELIGEVKLADLFAEFPVAVLISTGTPSRGQSE